MMNTYRLTASVTTIANALASRLNVEETTLLAALFVQLGDTLATIAAHRTICESKSDGNNGQNKTRVC